jgi:outer membrane protein assembly factor BamB
MHWTPAVVDGVVYVGGADGHIYALDAAFGSPQWTFQTGGRTISSPAVVDGSVFVGNYDGCVYALNATDGTQHWRFTSSGPVGSSPVVVDDTVYVASADRVYALSGKTHRTDTDIYTPDVAHRSVEPRDDSQRTDTRVYTGQTCGACGASLPAYADAAFCPDCGTEL